MKQILLSAFTFCIFNFLQAQTTQDEYNYITKGIKVQAASGLDAKAGYIIDFNEEISVTSDMTEAEMTLAEYPSAQIDGGLLSSDRTFELGLLRRKVAGGTRIAAGILRKTVGTEIYYFVIPFFGSDEVIVKQSRTAYLYEMGSGAASEMLWNMMTDWVLTKDVEARKKNKSGTAEDTNKKTLQIKDSQIPSGIV